MPKHSVKTELPLTTRGYTKANAEISITIDGHEVPSTAVLGAALDQAVDIIQQAIVKSYEVVPARV